MSVQTRGQVMAQAAYARIAERAKHEAGRKEYRSFAREFPTLVHQCGLAQASAFALAKGGQQEQYLGDLAAVLGVETAGEVGRLSREKPLETYVRLSRDSLLAAVWLKRYVEALFPEEK